MAPPPSSPVPQQPQHLPHLLLLVQGQVDLIDLPPWDGIGWDEQADPWVVGGYRQGGEPQRGPPALSAALAPQAHPAIPVLGIMSRPPKKLKVP